MFHALLFLPVSTRAGGEDVHTWLSWTALQAIPSPTFTADNGNGNSRVVTSFRWQITPINYSWSANELVPALSYLKVNPVRRYAGSAEFYVQPEMAFGGFRNTGLQPFSFSLGSRAFLPVVEYGEYLSLSLGARYVIRESISGGGANTFAGEIGMYTLFGLVGMRLGIGADPAARYSLSICLKYY